MKVGRLAFEGRLREEVIFKQLPEGCSDLGLLVEHRALYTRKEMTTFNFFHLTLQEYMSAFYISQLPASEQRTLFIEHSTSMNVVWRFVAGLTKMQNIGWDEFKRVKISSTYEFVLEDDEVTVGPYLIQCLYEAQDVKSCKIFSYCRVTFNPDDLSMTKYALYVLGYSISACSNAWNVTARSLSEVGLEMLGHGMKSVEYGGGSIDKLDLSLSRRIMNEGEHLLQLPHQILQHITSLNLYLCGIDHRGFENLAKCIPYLCSLTSLYVGENPGGVGDLVKLFHALRKHGKLQKLNIKGTGIGKDDVAALSNLVHPSSSLRKLTVGEYRKNVHVPAEVYQQLVRTVLSPSSLETLQICTTTESPLEYVQSISANIIYLEFTCLLVPSTTPKSPSTSESLPKHESSPSRSSSSSFPWSSSVKTSPEQSAANPGRIKGGTRLSHILRENTSLKQLTLRVSLDRDEVHDIVHSLEDNHSLEKLELLEEYHSKYFSESERQAMRPRIVLWLF